MKYYITILVVTIIVFFIGINYQNEPNKNVSNQEEIYINTNIDIDDYVSGVIACEIPASFNEEAIKANILASRTFALFQINNNPNYDPYLSTEQCYINEEEQKEKWKDKYETYHNKILNLIESTKNEVITYNNELIKSYYFSTSNGQTENVQTVFKNDYSYLVSVSSDWDKNVNGFEKNVIYPISEFLNMLNISSNKIENIEIIERNSTNHVDKLKVNNNEFTGIEFRKKLSLRSTDFDITYDYKNVYIITRGYGHDVGLSQYGANEMAKLGYNYKDIIKHYYTDVEIKMYKI